MLHIAQNKNGAVFRGQRLYGLPQHFTELTVFQSLGRYFAPIRDVTGNIVSVIALGTVFKRFIKVAALLAYPHLGLIDHDLGQPSAEFGFLPKLPQGPKCFENRFLRHLLGICFVSDNGECRQKDPALVGSKELQESLMVTV